MSEHGGATVRITVTVANRYTIETTQVTGRWVKEVAGIPADFSLHRRSKDGNQSIADDAEVELRNGDHFFARPATIAP
jgi:hypothetical protein